MNIIFEQKNKIVTIKFLNDKEIDGNVKCIVECRYRWRRISSCAKDY